MIERREAVKEGFSKSTERMVITMPDDTLAAFDPEQEATEFTEGIRSVIRFTKMDKAQRLAMIKAAVDKQIGTDPGAALPAIPGLTPAITEAVTDPLLDLIVKAVDGWLFGGDGD